MAKEIDQQITSGWRRFGQYNTFLRDKKNANVFEEENHEHRNIASNDIWSRDMVAN